MLPSPGKLLSAILIGFLAAAAGRAEEFQDKSRHYSLTLPKGWAVMPASEIAKANMFVAKRMPGQKISYISGFQLIDRPASGYPYIFVEWVSGTNAGSYDDIERIIKKQQPNFQGQAKQAQGAFADVLKGLSMGEMVLDRERNRTMVRLNLNVAGTGKVQALSIGFLGKNGTLILHCYEREAAVRDSLPTFEKILDSFRYEPGYEFRPSSSIWGGGFARTVAIGGIAGAFVGGIIALMQWLKKKKAAGEKLAV